MYFNKLTLLGHICRPPEMAYLKDGTPWIRFQVASKNLKGKATYFNCSQFGKSAEYGAKMLQGDCVLIEGSIEDASWTDKQGNKRKDMKVTVAPLGLQFLHHKGGMGETAQQEEHRKPVHGSDVEFPDYEPEPGDIPF